MNRSILLLFIVIVVLACFLLRSCVQTPNTPNITPFENILPTIHDTLRIKSDNVVEKDVIGITKLENVINALREDSTINKEKSLLLAKELEYANKKIIDLGANLNSVTKVNSELSIKINDLKANMSSDSVFYVESDSEDKWAKWKVSFDYPNREFDFDYKSWDEITFLGFTKEGKSYISAQNKNPNVKIRGMNEFLIIPPKPLPLKRIGLGAVFGYGAYLDEGKISSGFGVTLGAYYRIY
jgi:hypothetical protein